MPTRGCPTSGRFCREWGFSLPINAYRGKTTNAVQTDANSRVPHFRPVLPEVGVFSSDQCISRENNERRSNRYANSRVPHFRPVLPEVGFFPSDQYISKESSERRSNRCQLGLVPPLPAGFAGSGGFLFRSMPYRRKTANAVLKPMPTRTGAPLPAGFAGSGGFLFRSMRIEEKQDVRQNRRALATVSAPSTATLTPPRKRTLRVACNHLPIGYAVPSAPITFVS